MTGDEDVYKAIGDFLTLIVPGLVVTQGMENFVAPPTGNFAVMWVIDRQQIATNQREYDPDGDLRTVVQATRVRVQLDIHGDASGDDMQTFVSLYRDGYAWDNMPEIVRPLDCTDGRLLNFPNGESVWEQRWSTYVDVQINPEVSTPQQFADSLTPVLISVDAEFPPA